MNSAIDAFLEQWSISWRPGIGDPSIGGWFTVAAYFTAFLLSLLYLKNGRISQESNPRSFTLFWLLMTLVMLFLCINKQLDLQSLMTDIGRVTLRRLDLYEYKRKIQLAFIAGICCGAILVALVMIIFGRPIVKRYPLAVFGLLFVITFVLVRAMSFHHIDRFLGYSIFKFRMNWILELTGIFCVAISAAVNLRKKSS